MFHTGKLQFADRGDVNFSSIMHRLFEDNVTRDIFKLKKYIFSRNSVMKDFKKSQQSAFGLH